jgi:hypothetical protein
VLDGLMIAASLLLVSWVLVLSPLFRGGGDNLMSQAISLAYPIGDVVVGTIVLFVLARARRRSGTRAVPLSLVGGGLVAWAVWQRANPHRDKPLTLSVNLSGRQLQHAQVIQDISEALRDSGLPPSSLVLEMTESVLLDDNENVLASLRQLKELGPAWPSTTSAPATPRSATCTTSPSTSSRSTGRSWSGSATPATTPSWPAPSSASARASSWSRWPRGSRTRPSS